MTTHTFTLVLESPQELTEEFEDAVFEAGCDDAALSHRGPTLYLQFDREAPSFRAAVLSAIRDVHGVPGARIARVEPDELVTATEIADRIGRTRESIRLLVEGARGPGGFPPAVSGASGRRIRFWRWSEVASWLEDHSIAGGLRAQGRIIAAVNGALDLVRNAEEGTREEVLDALTAGGEGSSP